MTNEDGDYSRLDSKESALAFFSHAFSVMVHSSSGICECGRLFFDSAGPWDFEDSELDRLQADPDATDLGEAVSFVEMEGGVFVSQCDCWHERANRIASFIIGHDRQIAKFLNARRKAALLAAKLNPCVDGYADE